MIDIFQQPTLLTAWRNRISAMNRIIYARHSILARTASERTPVVEERIRKTLTLANRKWETVAKQVFGTPYQKTARKLCKDGSRPIETFYRGVEFRYSDDDLDCTVVAKPRHHLAALLGDEYVFTTRGWNAALRRMKDAEAAAARRPATVADLKQELETLARKVEEMDTAYATVKMEHKLRPFPQAPRLLRITYNARESAASKWRTRWKRLMRLDAHAFPQWKSLSPDAALMAMRDQIATPATREVQTLLEAVPSPLDPVRMLHATISTPGATLFDLDPLLEAERLAVEVARAETAQAWED